MGVDSIWLSPFYKNKLDTCPNVTSCDESNQNYDWNDVTDHTKVGSRFGSENDLDDLLAELKKHGNSIIYLESINLFFWNTPIPINIWSIGCIICFRPKSYHWLCTKP